MLVVFLGAFHIVNQDLEGTYFFQSASLRISLAMLICYASSTFVGLDPHRCQLLSTFSSCQHEKGKGKMLAVGSIPGIFNL